VYSTKLMLNLIIFKYFVDLEKLVHVCFCTFDPANYFSDYCINDKCIYSNSKRKEGKYYCSSIRTARTVDKIKRIKREIKKLDNTEIYVIESITQIILNNLLLFFRSTMNHAVLNIFRFGMCCSLWKHIVRQFVLLTFSLYPVIFYGQLKYSCIITKEKVLLMDTIFSELTISFRC
jgi:hypothetical protein